MDIPVFTDQQYQLIADTVHGLEYLAGPMNDWDKWRERERKRKRERERESQWGM